MSAKALVSVWIVGGILASTLAWAGERPAANVGKTDAIRLAGLIQVDPEDGDAREKSQPLPPPPPPPPRLRKLEDPGYTTLQDSRATSPFIEEKAPERSTTPEANGGAPHESDAAPKATTATPLWEKVQAETEGQEPQDPEEELQQWRLFNWPRLEARRIDISGWLDQGITLNGNNPLNRFNGPVTFNDRSNEYQMNQLYLYAERKTILSNFNQRIADLFFFKTVFFGKVQKLDIKSGIYCPSFKMHHTPFIPDSGNNLIKGFSVKSLKTCLGILKRKSEDNAAENRKSPCRNFSHKRRSFSAVP